MFADSRRAPSAGDVIIAAVTAAVSLGALLLIRPLLGDAPGAEPPVPGTGTAAWWLVAGVIVVQCLMLCWAGPTPGTVVISVTVAAFLLALTAPGAVFDTATFAIPVAVFLGFRDRVPRTLWVVLGTAMLIFAAAGIVNGIGGEGSEPIFAIAEAVVQTGGLFGVPVLLAVMLRTRRESRQAQQRELDALTRERDALVAATVARERTAMARELHDIAAHHLSGIALMASAVERQVGSDPAAARVAAGRIRVESTAVLQNLRRVVGLLREDGVAERSVETFGSVADLVRETAAARGADVQLRTLRSDDGRVLGAGVGPLAQLAAYRTIQEALANAAMHAPGASCLVEIDDTHVSEVRVLVRNAPAVTGPASRRDGYGLVGMRERADLVGAELRYGSTRTGGWEVSLTIPRDAVGEDPARTGEPNP